MNLLLLSEAEVVDSTATISGPRVTHIRAVLKKGPGDSVRAAVARKGRTVAEILKFEGDTAFLRLGPLRQVPPPDVHVVVALPRPKALSRLVASAASFGLSSLTLVNAWKVEKSYFASPRLEPARLFEDAWLGCEQGAQTWPPSIRVFTRLVPFLKDEVPRLFPQGAKKLLLHPHAEVTLDAVLRESDPRKREALVLAFGPEGGFIEAEIESFREAGFEAVRINTGPLKTEVALCAVLGQVALLRPPIENPAADM